MKIIAIDVGGTNIKFGLYDKGLRDFKIASTPKNKKDFIKAILQIAAQYPDVNKIGIGLPGIVDRQTGKILNLPNLPFLNGLNIIEYLSKPGFEVKIDNDVKCYLRAELKQGIAKNYKNLVLVSLGTGVGAGIVIDGKIYYGQGAAGEVGGMVMDYGKHLSFFAAGKTLKKFDKIEMQRVSKYLGYALVSLINIFDPEMILLSGGLVRKFSKQFAAGAIKIARKGLISPRAKKVPILISDFGEQAGVIGAALLF